MSKVSGLYESKCTLTCYYIPNNRGYYGRQIVCLHLALACGRGWSNHKHVSSHLECDSTYVSSLHIQETHTIDSCLPTVRKLCLSGGWTVHYWSTTGVLVSKFSTCKRGPGPFPACTWCRLQPELGSERFLLHSEPTQRHQRIWLHLETQHTETVSQTAFNSSFK